MTREEYLVSVKGQIELGRKLINARRKALDLFERRLEIARSAMFDNKDIVTVRDYIELQDTEYAYNKLANSLEDKNKFVGEFEAQQYYIPENER